MITSVLIRSFSKVIGKSAARVGNSRTLCIEVFKILNDLNLSFMR